MTSSPRCSWPTAASSTSTRRSPATGPSSPPTARRPSRCATSWPTPPGSPAGSEPIEEADLYDWEKATSLLAAQAPLWEPGTASGYHALTQGYLVGEVIRRVTGGTTVGQLFAKEIAGPLGADFHIGTGPEHDHRVARVIPPPQSLGADLGDLDPDSIDRASRSATRRSTRRWSWSEAWRRAEIPAAGGHGNARSVARCSRSLSHGGEVDGIRLLSPAGCEVVFERQISGTDLVLPAAPHAWAWATASARPRCRSVRTSAPASGAGGADRSWSTTSRTASPSPT